MMKNSYKIVYHNISEQSNDNLPYVKFANDDFFKHFMKTYGKSYKM